MQPMKQTTKAQNTDNNTVILYAGYRFLPELISYAVCLYFRFRMVEEMLAARGIDVTYETVRRWALKFGQETARRIRSRSALISDNWYLDEVGITINGGKHWLWRAVDQFGIVLDALVQSRRDRHAAQRLMRKLLRRCGVTPRVPVADKLKSYAAANKDVGLHFEHRQNKGLNNRAENSHEHTRVREKVMRRFKSACQLQRFVSVHDEVANLFHCCRSNVSATEKRANRSQAFAAWERVTCANTFGLQNA